MRKITNEEIRQATEAQRIADATEPRAVSVQYDSATKRLVIDLRDGVTVAIPVAKIQGLAGAAESDLAAFELWSDGEEIEWESLDMQYTIPQLVGGIYGTKKWMTEMQRKGGLAKTPAKSAAARKNGKMGGRPRKAVPPPAVSAHRRTKGKAAA